jgi:hypothetical protein
MPTGPIQLVFDDSDAPVAKPSLLQRVKASADDFIGKRLHQLSGEEEGILNPDPNKNPAIAKSFLPETKQEPGILGAVRHGLYENIVRPALSPVGAIGMMMGEAKQGTSHITEPPPPPPPAAEFAGQKGADAAFKLLNEWKGPVDARAKAAHEVLDRHTLENRQGEIARMIYGEKGRLDMPTRNPDYTKGLKIVAQPQSIVDRAKLYEQNAAELNSVRDKNLKTLDKEFQTRVRQRDAHMDAVDKAQERAQTTAAKAATGEARRDQANLVKVERWSAKNQANKTKELARDQQNLADVMEWAAKKKAQAGENAVGEIQRDQKNLADVTKWAETQSKKKAAQSLIDSALEGKQPTQVQNIKTRVQGTDPLNGQPIGGTISYEDPNTGGAGEVNGPQMPPSLERDSLSAKTFTNRADADALARYTRGRVNQVGPRAYRVVFDPELPVEEPPQIAGGDEPPSIANDDPKGPKSDGSGRYAGSNDASAPLGEKPRTGWDEIKDALGPEGFRRYMDTRPLVNVKRTPEEIAEHYALAEKVNAFKEGKSAKFAESTNPTFDAQMDDLHGPDTDLPPDAANAGSIGGRKLGPEGFDLTPSETDQQPIFGPQPGEDIPLAARLKAAGDKLTEINRKIAAGEPVNEEARAIAGQEAQRLHNEFLASNPSWQEIEQLSDPSYGKVIEDLLTRSIKSLKNSKLLNDEAGRVIVPEMDLSRANVWDKLKGVGDFMNNLRRGTLLNPYSMAKHGIGDIQALTTASVLNPSKAPDIAKNIFTRDTLDDFMVGLKAPAQGAEDLTGGINASFASGKNPLSWAGRSMAGMTTATRGIFDRAGFTPGEAAGYTLTKTPSRLVTNAAYEFLNKPVISHFNPFSRIGLNWIEQGYEHSPFGLLDVLSKELTPEERMMVFKKAGLGTAAMGTAYGATPDDFVKEHPIASRMLSAGVLGPSVMFGMAMKNKGNDQFLKALADIIGETPGMHTAADLAQPRSFARNYLASYTNVTKPIAEALDPVERDLYSNKLSTTEKLTNKALSNIPGVRNTLPVKEEKKPRIKVIF